MALTWDSTIREDLEMVEEEMRHSVLSEQKILTEISLYVIGAGGKRMRPAVAILSFKANGGQPEELKRVIKVASAFELIHSATLIHDDINDDGEFRRGREAAYRRYGTQKALIAGDFLFVKSFRLGGTFDQRIIDLVAEACTAIAESEILQSDHELDPDTPLDAYIKIIEGKTAKPIEAGARVGAYLAKVSNEQIDAMGYYGLNIGIAFQIIDDILDVVGNEATLGKGRGVDFMDSKPNLSLLLAMKDKKHGARIKELFLLPEKEHRHRDEALDLVRKTDAIDQAKKMAYDYTKKAEEALAHLPETDYKRSMIMLAETLASRKS